MSISLEVDIGGKVFKGTYVKNKGFYFSRKSGRVYRGYGERYNGTPIMEYIRHPKKAGEDVGNCWWDEFIDQELIDGRYEIVSDC